MKIPAFIKQIVKFCDTESVRYALGCVQVKSSAGTASLTATDGRILANVYWEDDGPEMEVLVNGKQLASPPAAAFKDTKGVVFDGTTLTYGSVSLKPEPCDGRFPRYEDVFSIHDDPAGYVAVKLDAAMLKSLADLAGAVSSDTTNPSICLWVKDSQSAVFAAAYSDSGHTARLVQMPLAADELKQYGYPPRPGSVVAADDDASVTADSDDPEPEATDDHAPAPVPEMMTDVEVGEMVANSAPIPL